MATDQANQTPSYGVDTNLGDPGDRPYFRFLTDSKIERIHETVVQILGTIGVKVARPEAVDMMADAGCEIVGEGDIVRVPRRILEDAIASAPKRITIYNREGEEALYLGSQEVYTRTGYTPLEFFDLETRERRNYTLEDFRVVSRVADALLNVDVIGQPGTVRPSKEDPLEVINHLEFEAMITNTSKPISTLVASGEILDDCLEMAEAVAIANGATSLREKPFVMPMQNPITPLMFNEETVDKVLVSADWGIPVICGPLALAGGTSPATLAGTIALCTAESLFGLVLSQIRRKGTPYVMRSNASGMDMRTGNPTQGPESILMSASCHEMAHYYGVPITGGSIGGGNRGTLDFETGSQQALNGVARVFLRCNAGLGVGAGSSLEACVLADEMMAMLKVMMKGVEVDDDTLALDVIREIGPGGGTYLGHPHTFRHFRDRWEPTFARRLRYEDWVADGSKTLDEKVRARLFEIIETHQPLPFPEAARKPIAEIIARARSRVPVEVA